MLNGTAATLCRRFSCLEHHKFIMFILIYKTFSFDFYHASEIVFFGNTAQRKRTLGDLHVSMRSRYIATLRWVAHKTMGWHTKRWVARKTKGWHTKRRVARKTKGGTQNDGMARKTMVWHAKRWYGTQNDGWHAKRLVAHKTIGEGN